MRVAAPATPGTARSSRTATRSARRIGAQHRGPHARRWETGPASVHLPPRPTCSRAGTTARPWAFAVRDSEPQLRRETAYREAGQRIELASGSALRPGRKWRLVPALTGTRFHGTGELRRLGRDRRSLSGSDLRGWSGAASYAHAAPATVAGGGAGARGPHRRGGRPLRRCAGHLRALRGHEAEALHQWGRALSRAGADAEAGERFDQALDVYRRHDAGPACLEGCRPIGVRSSGRAGERGNSGAGWSNERALRRRAQSGSVAHVRAGRHGEPARPAKGGHRARRAGPALIALDLVPVPDGSARRPLGPDGDAIEITSVGDRGGGDGDALETSL